MERDTINAIISTNYMTHHSKRSLATIAVSVLIAFSVGSRDVPVVGAFQLRSQTLRPVTIYQNFDLTRNDPYNDNINNRCNDRTSIILCMAGGSKSLHKQAALRQKLEQAKQQNSEQQQQSSSSLSSNQQQQQLSEKEIRERNDRLRFEELLQKGGTKNLFNDDDGEYKTTQQIEDEIDAVRSGRDLLFEGDPAPTECFEELVSIKTENAIGLPGKQRLVPWLRKSTARHQDYIVIITDPRMQSIELRETVKVLMIELSADIKDRLIVVNADSPAENRRWLKKVGLFTQNNDNIQQQQLQQSAVEVYSDEKMEFMRTYTALGDQRWSMSIFIIASGRIQKLIRNVDQYTASKTIQNAIKSYLEETRISIKKMPS